VFLENAVEALGNNNNNNKSTRKGIVGILLHLIVIIK